MNLPRPGSRFDSETRRDGDGAPYQIARRPNPQPGCPGTRVHSPAADPPRAARAGGGRMAHERGSKRQEAEMAEASPVADRRIDRRIVLKAAATMAAAGPVVLGGRYAEAQPRAGDGSVLFAYVGAFTTPARKGHGGGINVYRVDPASGAWSHEQLLEIANPSFLALDRAPRFLYAVHADLDEVSAYAIDTQTGHITALNRQSCGGKNPVHLAIDPTGRWILPANYAAGSVGVVPIEKDGTLGTRADLV